MRRFALALVVSLFSLAAAAQPSGEQPGAVDPASATADDAVPQFAYRLGAGDKVRIIVFDEPSLTGEFLVPGGEGDISFPLVGDVRAGGLTVSELQAELEAKLRDGFLRDPHVSIEVLNYRPFYILGEVSRPGEYPYTSGLTVLNAVATAGGFTYRANTSRVYIRRADEPKEEAERLTTTTLVEPGDTIRIGERFF